MGESDVVHVLETSREADSEELCSAVRDNDSALENVVFDRLKSVSVVVGDLDVVKEIVRVNDFVGPE